MFSVFEKKTQVQNNDESDPTKRNMVSDILNTFEERIATKTREEAELFTEIVNNLEAEWETRKKSMKLLAQYSG